MLKCLLEVRLQTYHTIALIVKLIAIAAIILVVEVVVAVILQWKTNL